MSETPISPLELLRRLENILRAGTIHAVDHGGARVRVASGELVSNWLPWFERRAGNVRSWCPPSVGEQCMVLSPGGDLASGMVLVGVNSDAHPAPSDSPTLHRVEFPDGAVIDYDHASHTLTITAQDLIINGAVAISGPSLTHNGTNVGSSHHHGGVQSGGSNTGAPQ